MTAAPPTNLTEARKLKCTHTHTHTLPPSNPKAHYKKANTVYIPLVQATRLLLFQVTFFIQNGSSVTSCQFIHFAPIVLFCFIYLFFSHTPVPLLSDPFQHLMAVCDVREGLCRFEGLGEKTLDEKRNQRGFGEALTRAEIGGVGVGGRCLRVCV